MSVSQHPQGKQRQGFTAIELLIVVLIMALLGAMAIPAILPALQRSRVNTAAALIQEAAAQAQQLAQESYAPSNGWHYGVYLGPDGDGNTVVGVTYAPASVGSAFGALGVVDGDSVASSNAVTLGATKRSDLGVTQRPIFLRELPATALIYTGGDLLGENSLGWAYHYGTGTVTKAETSAFSPGVIEVGTRAQNFTDVFDLGTVGSSTSGGIWKDTYDVSTSVIAATGADDIPGLSIRSPSDGYRVAIRVYAPGLFIREEF